MTQIVEHVHIKSAISCDISCDMWRTSVKNGPALSTVMAEWSKALPLTAPCLSLLHRFESWTRACEKVASDLGFRGWFSTGTPINISFATYNWLVII